MKSNTRFFGMAALIVAVATLVGCTKENIGNGNGLTFTTTVEMPANGTKALDANGHKTFAEGECIKVTCDGGSSTCTSEPLTYSDISADGKAAKFTFNFESTPTLTSGSTVTYEYPAAHSGLSGQDGTLATLQSTYDYASCSPTVTETGSLPSNIQLQNQYAILKLFIKNSVDNDITESITRLTITNGTNTVIVNRSAAAGPIYVAVPAASGNIVFEAYDGYCTRTKTVSGQTIDAGKLYPVNVQMPAVTVTWDGNTLNGITLEGDGEYYNNGGIAATLGGNSFWMDGNVYLDHGEVVFYSSIGNITSIEMTGFSISGGNLEYEWTDGPTWTWSGSEPYVVLAHNEGYWDEDLEEDVWNIIEILYNGESQIVFTVE